MSLGQSQSLTRNFPLYLYGNNCIQNSRYGVWDYPRISTPFEIQKTPIARGAGSTIVNKKETEKELNFDEVGIIVKENTVGYEVEFQKTLEKFKQIMSYDDRYLRVMPNTSYVVLHNPSTITGWSLSAEGNTLALDTDEFQLDQASLSFNTTVTGSNFVSISSTTQISVDLSTFLNPANNSTYLPQFERWVYIPDETEITSIDIRVGSSSTNYYSKTLITTNYEGKPLVQGWNYLSVPFSSMSTIGSPNNASIGSYQYVQFNYTSATPNLSGFRIDALLLTKDAYVRNYRCYRTGEVGGDDNAFKQLSNSVKFKLINYTGYGEGTQSETLFNATGITALSDTQIVQLNGNHDLLPSITMNLNSTTNLNQLKFSNVNTSQFIYFSNTWANGDKLVIDNLNKSVTKNSIAQDFINGKLPVFSPGRNKVRIEVIGGTQQIVNQTVGTSSLNTVGTLPSYQSFTVSLSVATGILAEASVKLEVTETNPTTISIYSDSGGAPGSLLGTYSLVWGGVTNPETYSFYPNLSVNNATKYWIRLDQYVVSGGFSSYSLTWYYSSTDQYAGGNRYYSGSAQSGDYVFKVVVNPTIATNINWGMSYKRLYS